jgi:hypothetical protein
MAIYYVRNDGNDSNTGTGPAINLAWQTLQKALGATSGLVGGDIVYVAPGRYTENVAVNITSPSSQVRIVGDPSASQFSGLSSGVVLWTTMNATGVNITTFLLGATSKSNLSFENFYFELAGTSNNQFYMTLSTCQNIQFKKCLIDANGISTNTNILTISCPSGQALNATIDSCIFNNGAQQLQLSGTSGVSDTTVIKNCLFIGSKSSALLVPGANVNIVNNTFINAGTAINANPTSSIASTIRNCLFVSCISGAFWSANVGTAATFCRRVGTGGFNNVTEGATNTSNGANGLDNGYRQMHNLQSIFQSGSTLGSVNTSFGNTTGAPTTDLFDVLWSGTSPDAGAITYRNLGTITPIYQPTDRQASAITIAPGSTSQSIEVYLGATGLTASTAGLSARYNRTRTASVDIPLVARTIAQAWTSGGFAEVDATNMPGVYRLDVPDAAFAAGASDVTIVVRGASGTNGAVLTVTLSSGGLTAAQTADAVWGASVAGYTTATDFGGVVNQIDNTVTGIDAVVQDIPSNVWEELRANHDTAGSFGEYVNAELTTPVTGSSVVRMGPFEVRADGLGASDPLDIQKGAQHGIDIQCVDNNGGGIDITSATVTAKVYNSGATLVDTYSCTATYAADGRAQFTIDTTVTNTPGTYTATITRTTGASDTQVFGPLRIYVRDI